MTHSRRVCRFLSSNQSPQQLISNREEKVISKINVSSAAVRTCTVPRGSSKCYLSWNRGLFPTAGPTPELCDRETFTFPSPRSVWRTDQQRDWRADSCWPSCRSDQVCQRSLEGRRLIFIRHDRLKPHLPCHAVDPQMEEIDGRLEGFLLPSGPVWLSASPLPLF